MIRNQEIIRKEERKMSLLWMEYETEFEHLVEASFARESHDKAEYFRSLSEHVRKIIYRDTRGIISTICTRRMCWMIRKS